jgi:hypothetical protein
MPLHDGRRFVPESNGGNSLFRFGLEKIHMYETDGGRNKYGFKTDAVGRNCKDVMHMSSDNLMMFKCIILQNALCYKVLYW